MKNNIKIMATDLRTNEEFEVQDDLYFFEEEGIRNFGGDGHNRKYQFEIFVNNELVYSTKEKLHIFSIRKDG